ncbi:MAG: hypothetical protein GYA33_11100 [Thermogutta sp.]|nr:hypothetical protein [Thermogutta sp.]
MKRISAGWAVCGLCVLGCWVVLPGCGGTQDAGKPSAEPARKSTSAQSAATGTAGVAIADNTADPVAATKVFLEAVRTGDDEKVVAMFTESARQQAGELNRQFAPVGSDTASYKVSDKVQFLAEDGARVMSTWTDLGPDGKPRSDDIMWMLRKEPGGWRIAGMAAVIFPGEPPLLLDFENMKETLRKVELLAEELERRQTDDPAAAGQGTPESQGEAAPRDDFAGGQAPGSQDIQYTPAAALPDRMPAAPTMQK